MTFDFLICSRRIAIVLLLCVTGAVRAENDCGSMLRTMSRFRGTVRSVRPIASLTKAKFMAVDLDPSFVASIDVDGKTLAFGIHSPPRMGGVSFTNADVVTRAEQEIVFDVVELRIDQEGERQWISVYRATIV